MDRGAYQAWNFGPMLLDRNGEIKTEYNASKKVHDVNPRAAIGYAEPGHYYMVVADGRSSSSVGLSLNSLSNLFAELGCKAAYNMDGGQTAVMVCGSEVINDQAGDGRQCSDFVMVVDEIVEEFAQVQKGAAK
jgi:exopolysaccharide biosynthesis protein